MSFISCNFGEALNAALQADSCLIDLSCHNQNDTDGNPRISIAEYGPDVDCLPPYLAWKLIETQPLVTDLDLSGWYSTDVWIYAVTDNALDTRKLADAAQTFFASRPQGAGRKWFRDITNDCIFNRFTRFIRRINIGNSGQSQYNFGEDSWVEAIHCEFIWRDCGCSGLTCEEPVVERCEVTNIDNDFDPLCKC